MKIAGIAAEYNPFHNGHAHHIARTRDEDGGGATHIVAVMSGCFTQRGEPAMLPEGDRVRMALAGGADLVIGLPLPWSLASAEGFAFGMVSALDALGCVDIISFGSESGDIAALQKAADCLSTDRFAQLLRYHLDYGISFPEARQRAVQEIAGNRTAELFSSPNNTLGIEYLKALHRLDSPIVPYTIPRFGAGHDETYPLGDTASASYIRTLAQAGRLVAAAPFLPAASMEILSAAAAQGHCPADVRLLERAVLAKLRRMSREELAKLPGISEGIENRLYEAVSTAGTLEELESRVKTKRYPLTRIRRLIWSAFLDIPAGWEGRTPPYLRVLGMNGRGREILSAAKAAKVPLLTRVSQRSLLGKEADGLYALEARAVDLYALALPTPLPCGTLYTDGLVRVE